MSTFGAHDVATPNIPKPFALRSTPMGRLAVVAVIATTTSFATGYLVATRSRESYAEEVARQRLERFIKVGGDIGVLDRVRCRELMIIEAEDAPRQPWP